MDVIVEVLMRVESSTAGLTLWYRHRHLGGRLTDCPAEAYGPLSRAELVDVLFALSDRWGPYPIG